jgi:hypothetical protein
MKYAGCPGKSKDWDDFSLRSRLEEAVACPEDEEKRSSVLFRELELP